MTEETMKAEMEYLKEEVLRIQWDLGRLTKTIQEKDAEILYLRKELHRTKVQLFEGSE